MMLFLLRLPQELAEHGVQVLDCQGQVPWQGPCEGRPSQELSGSGCFISSGLFMPAMQTRRPVCTLFERIT